MPQVDPFFYLQFVHCIFLHLLKHFCINFDSKQHLSSCNELKKKYFICRVVNNSYLLQPNMSRYQDKASTLDVSRVVQQPVMNLPPKHRFHKKGIISNPATKANTNPSLNTIDPSSLNDLHITFQLKQTLIEKRSPGVGDYDISSPIVKPSYQTYQKNEQVILVKINHIGGTSSFRSEGERFIEGNSIYASSPAPGPGAYHLPSRTNRKLPPTSSYHQSYDFIQELLRNRRERTESMPNYQIGAGKSGLEYNGLPKHLQDMYNNLHSDRKEGQITKSLPLDRLIKLRKRTERLPIVETKRQETLVSPKKKHVMERMTETLYRLDEQLKKDEKRAEKIRAILKPSTQTRSNSLRKQTPQVLRAKAHKQGSFNKNMVNMLFQLTKR